MTASTRTRIGSLLVALLLVAAPVIGQSDDLARVRSQLGDPDTQRIAAVIDQAVRDGLPRAMLVDKAVEGVAKGMMADVVITAVSAYADELRAAAAVVGRDADADRLDEAAHALERGIDPGLLSYLNREVPDQFSIMIVALEDLLDLGVDQQLAEDLMRYAGSQRLDADKVLALPAEVEKQVRDGRSVTEAAASVSRNLRRGGGTASVADRPLTRSIPTRADRGIPPIV